MRLGTLAGRRHIGCDGCKHYGEPRVPKRIKTALHFKQLKQSKIHQISTFKFNQIFGIALSFIGGGEEWVAILKQC